MVAATFSPMRLRTFPSLPISLLFASALMVVFGIVSDFAPPARVGELRPATVLAVQPYVVVRVDTDAGPVDCALAEGPPLARFSRTTVDYGPTGCYRPPVSEQLSRSEVLALGIGGMLLMSFWLWAGRRAGF